MQKRKSAKKVFSTSNAFCGKFTLSKEVLLETIIIKKKDGTRRWKIG